MRASVAGLLAACALIGIPRLAGELREYRKERQKPAPLAISLPPESSLAARAGPVPKELDAAALPKPSSVPQVLDAAALPKPATVSKVPDPPVLPKLAPVQFVSMQPDAAPAGTKPAGPANDPGLISAIQKELTRLSYYSGPITDKWSRPVRSAAREFLRKTGSRVRAPQPTAELLTALQAAESVKKQPAKALEAPRREEKPIHLNERVVIEAPSQENLAGPVPEAQDEGYLPPWMTTKTDQARLASKSEAGHSDEPVDASIPELAKAQSGDDTPKRHFHRRHHGERPWKGRYHYSRGRTSLFPF